VVEVMDLAQPWLGIESNAQFDSETGTRFLGRLKFFRSCAVSKFVALSLVRPGKLFNLNHGGDPRDPQDFGIECRKRKRKDIFDEAKSSSPDVAKVLLPRLLSVSKYSVELRVLTA